ncbi:hypothetical protein PBY51_016111 [Eleginops maclovinus]|uniref:Uncharacterized protein n=1 Tax=Eleginops maclovinus TaxID=56733 RepID=A0AAN7XQ08_ELEMC|nr:hypothetical protein PBY51_016111 [Eleginops maclovinus]
MMITGFTCRPAAGGRCSRTLALCLRSAACLRGVRLIVAGLNGGQSRIVALAPRTITSPLRLFPGVTPVRHCVHLVHRSLH